MTAAAWGDAGVASGLASRHAGELFSWARRLERMRDVEVALARALGVAGVVDARLAERVAEACEAVSLDADELAGRSADAATPVIPLLEALRKGMTAEESRVLHRGATSQDVIDTAMVLEARDALDLLEEELHHLADRCEALARQHRATPLMGRTLLQPALPVTFGLVAARWSSAVARRLDWLALLRPRLLVVQLGGPVGTGLGLGEADRRVLTDVAPRLDLGVPDLSWHAERDRVADLAGQLAALCGVVATIATDLVLLAATGEAVPGDRAGGSSAMGHKRNPVDAVAARAAARLATGQATLLLGANEHEHERAAGAWQVEWVALPRLFVHVCGAVERLAMAIDDLRIDAARMAATVRSHGSVTARQEDVDRLIDAALVAAPPG